MRSCLRRAVRGSGSGGLPKGYLFLCSGSFDGVVVHFDVYTLYCFSPIGSSRTRSTRPI